MEPTIWRPRVAGIRWDAMAGLDKVLQLFGHADVDEVILQSGRVVAVNKSGRLEAASKTPLAAAQLAGILQSEPELAEIPRPGAPASVQELERGALRVRCSVQCSRDQIVVRLARVGPAAAAAVAAAPAQRPTPRSDRPAQPPAPATAPAGAVPQAANRAPGKAAAPTARAAPRPAPRTAPQRAKSSAASPALEQLLGQARTRFASDVHLTSGRPPLIRVNGNLVAEGEVVADERLRSMLNAIMSERERAQLEDVGYTDFAYESANSGRYRANVCAHKNGIKGCFRVIASEPNTLEELGLPPELGKVIDHHQGLAIVAGPNGQGKTTTLAALVDLLNTTKAVHIITVEDPIEILHPIKQSILSQRQVGRDTRAFASALKGALRQDPDVIVIGELRDRETVEMALSAAETGHLVIATMNTPSGPKTIGRLIDLFPPDDQAQVRATLAGTLMIVVSQRLLPRSDGSGRVAAAEVITGGVPLWTLIRENKLVQLPGLMQRGRSIGMISLDTALEQLVADGTIERELALLYAQDKSAFGAEPSHEDANDPPEAEDQAGRFSGLRKMMGGR